jgi:hypothetical protein
MAQDNKVVSLGGAQASSRFSLPAALVRLRDQSGEALRKVLGSFFDRADDALFDMADRASTNQDQTAYFDAMRELRLRRKTMTVSILQHISRAFNDIGRFTPGSRDSVLQDIDEDALSLVDHSELEQRVAIDNLVAKLRNRNTEGIQLLTARVQSLVPRIQLAANQMPLSPEVICGGVSEACTDLDIDIRAKLVVLKLFDKLLADILANFYQEANRILIAEGVMPDMKRPPVQGRSPVPPSSSGGSAQQSGSAGRYVAAGHPTFSELSDLLHQGGEPAPEGSAVPPATGASGGMVLDTGSLMARLSELQPRAAEWEEGHVVPLSEQLRVALSSDAGQRYSVGQVDSDVINLVSMLFEFILEDRQLHPVMKALIGRLQIPVLKVALSDQNFFNRGGHPVRKLLNELAMSAIGWTEKRAGQRDPLRDKIEQVVERIVTGYQDNIGIFEELLQEFTHFADLDRRRRELVEQRLRDAEEGRARQERAATAANEALDQAIQGRELAEPVSNMLRDAWRKYLQWVLLREGEESESWVSARKLTDKLVWSVDPLDPDENTRSELLREIPGVVDGVRKALQDISWDPFATDNIIRDLELAHVDVFQRLVTFREAPAEPAVAPVETPVEAPAPEAPEALAEPEPEPEPVEEKAEVAPAEQSAMPTEQEASVSAEVPSALSDDALARADALRVGSWVELIRDDGKVRCKLAAFIKATGKYIFVNRSGAKIAEFLRDDLARAMQADEITMLDDGLIFDRALESIIDNLKHNRKD